MKIFLLTALLAASALADEPINLLANGGFDQDALGWDQFTNGRAFWDTPDADYNPFSGSVWIADSVSALGVFWPAISQCIRIDRAGNYAIRVSTYAATNQPSMAPAIRYIFEAGTVCDAKSDVTDDLTLSQSDTWQTVQVTTKYLPARGYVKLQIGTVRNALGSEVTSHFDNVIFTDDALFLGRFE